jgi:hypothetical protein
VKTIGDTFKITPAVKKRAKAMLLRNVELNVRLVANPYRIRQDMERGDGHFTVDKSLPGLSKTYRVTINVNGYNTCTCAPFAKEGVCKHLVAVIMHYDIVGAKIGQQKLAPRRLGRPARIPPGLTRMAPPPQFVPIGDGVNDVIENVYPLLRYEIGQLPPELLSDDDMDDITEIPDDGALLWAQEPIDQDLDLDDDELEEQAETPDDFDDILQGRVQRITQQRITQQRITQEDAPDTDEDI